MAGIQFMYGLANGNTSTVRRFHTEIYPSRRISSVNLLKFHQRFCEFSSFTSYRANSGPPRSIIGLISKNVF